MTVGNLMLKPSEIATEEELRAHLNNELNFAAKWVLDAFQIKGRFAAPGGGNVCIVGQADFSWVGRKSYNSKLAVCVLIPLILP